MTTTVHGLAHALRRVLPAASRDRKQSPALRCVLFETTGRRLRLVATDRHRLAVSELPRTGTGELRALVPADALADLALDDDAAVTLTRTDAGELELRAGDAVHVLATVDDDYPDVDPLLAAAASSTTVHLATGDVLDAIEGADDDEPLHIVLATGELRIADRALAVDYDGPELGLHVDASYAHDAVVAVGTDTLAVDVAGPRSPVAFRSEDGHVTLLMPVLVATPRR